MPHVLAMMPVIGSDGTCRAEFPELRDCAVEAALPIDAIDEREERRERLILERLALREPVSEPRPALVADVPAMARRSAMLSAERELRRDKKAVHELFGLRPSASSAETPHPESADPASDRTTNLDLCLRRVTRATTP